MKNIVYLCFNYPFPEKIGEEHNIASHIKDLALSKYANCIKMIFSNPNKNQDKFKYDNIDYQIFEPKQYKYNKFIMRLIYLLKILFSKYPENFTKIVTKDLSNAIKKQNPDIIVMDTLYSAAMLPKDKNYKLIFIAHNQEDKLYKDLANIEKRFFIKIYRYLYYLKIKKIEKDILKKADKIVCISTSDYNYFKRIYPEKVDIIPHKIELKADKWQENNDKTLFFCGPLSFEPNHDSVKWISEELAPILSRDIRIKIAGKGTDSVPDEWKKNNIDFLGFVSREELLDLYKTSSAFLCPIIYGSGVKIKVTEALGFGTPIIATKEALEGLDYIDIKPLIDRDNLQKTKENIENLLNNQECLKSYSQDLILQIENYQKQNNNSLEKIIDTLIIKDKHYDIISLGYDCAVRRYLTMGGLKKTKAQGELSMVFDLSYCPTKSIIKLLHNDFKDYFNNLVFKNVVWKNAKYKILYNHDKDCGINDKQKLIARFEKRIENFMTTIAKSQYCYFILKSISNKYEIHRLYKEIQKKRRGLPFKVVVFDVEHKLPQNYYFNEDIVLCSIKSPFPRTDDWWKAEFINSPESIEFQHNICCFIENIINQDFNVQKWNKEDVNQENGDY